MRIWRAAAAAIVVAAMIALGVQLVPYYFRNLDLQRFVEETAQRPGIQNQPDDALRAMVLARASDLHLPVRAENVQLKRSADDFRIEVRYVVRVNLPVYSVDLHFYPGAGSR